MLRKLLTVRGDARHQDLDLEMWLDDGPGWATIWAKLNGQEHIIGDWSDVKDWLDANGLDPRFGWVPVSE